MTVLHVAEPQPLWLSLQNTPPSPLIAVALVEVVLSSLGIAAALVEVVVGAAGILVEVVLGIVATLVEVADSAVAVAGIADSGCLFPLLLP